MPLDQPPSVPSPNPQLQKPVVVGLEKAPPVKIEPVQEAKIVAPPKPMENLSAPSWEGIPVDEIRYFGYDLGTMSNKDIEKMKDIDTWAKRDLLEDSIGNRLQKIRSLESKLGAPGLHETRLQKLWSWVKMDFNINELRTRQAAFEANSNMRDILR